VSEGPKREKKKGYGGKKRPCTRKVHRTGKGAYRKMVQPKGRRKILPPKLSPIPILWSRELRLKNNKGKKY